MQPRLAGPLGVLLLLALVPTANAQTTDPQPAPPLSQTVNVLYAHSLPDSTAHTMDTVAVRTDNNPGTSNLANAAFTWTMTLTPPLDRTVTLDGAKTVDFTLHLGGSQSVGRVSVTTALTSGGQTIAKGAAKDLAITPAGASPAPVNKYGTVTWQAPVELATLTAGQPVVWTVTATGTASAVFMGMSETRGRSAILLPVLSTSGGGAPTTYHDLAGATAAIALNASAPTNATHVYNWTSPGGDLVLAVADAGHKSGNATVRVLDAGNATLANVTFDGTSRQAAFTAAAGNWTIQVQLQGYAGNLTIALGPKAGSGPGPGGTGSGTASSTASGSGSKGASSSETGNATKANGKDTPGPAPILLAGLLVVAAVVARRRL